MTRDIVLVTVDSLRADHCGFLGADETSTLSPTLDALAADGVVFENAVTPGPRTPSSMPELFTGAQMLPASERQGGDYWQRQRARIRHHMHRHRTVAERLQERGYTTVGITTNLWTQGTGFDAGFDRFVEVNSETLTGYGPSVFKQADRILNGTRLGSRLSWGNKREWFIRWTDFYESVESVLTDASRPLFLWVFLLDTHQPYVTPAPFRRESSALGMYYASFSELARDGEIPVHVDRRLRKAYHDSVRSVDAFVKRTHEDGSDLDPVLVVHSDHGEAFGEHGTYGHERQVYGENVHVPLLIANAGRRERVNDPLSLRQLPDILTALAEDEAFHPERYTSAYAVSTTENCRVTGITGREWRYVRDDGDEELYHLPSDVDERRNVVDRHPAARDAFRRVANRYRAGRRERATIADAVREDQLGIAPDRVAAGSTGGDGCA